MTPKGKKTAIIVTSLLAIGGAVTFLLWKNKKGPFKDKSLPPPPPPPVESAPVVTQTSSGGSSGGSSSDIGKPTDILDFQKWVINTKGDKTILGGGGSTGFGDDGKWGSKTKKAWAQYKDEYSTSGNKAKNYRAYKKAWDSAKSKGQSTFWYTRLSVPGDTFFDGKKRKYVTSTGKQWVKPNTPLTGEALIGKTVYPSGSYVNVRDEARVDNSGMDNTFIGQINSPNAIGKVTNFTMGTESTPKRWYYVKLLTPLSESTHGISYANTYMKNGWIREDSIKQIMSSPN